MATKKTTAKAPKEAQNKAVNEIKEEKKMSKMAEMAQTIEELRTAAASINAAADWLYQQFSGDDNEVQATEAPTKKEPKPELKLEDVRAVLAGHTAEVRALLKKYGAAKLSEIDPTNYEALMKDAEVIGNGS